MEIVWRYEVVIKTINSTVLNKLQSYSLIAALGLEGHCTSRFTRAMCISYRPHRDVHTGEEGLAHVDRERRGKIRFFVDVINGWPPSLMILSILYTADAENNRCTWPPPPLLLKRNTALGLILYFRVDGVQPTEAQSIQV